MRARIALAAALAVAALSGHSAQALPGVAGADPVGDALSQQAGHDIVGFSISSTRAGKGKNAPVKDFTITLDTAGPAQAGIGTIYTVEGMVEGCGAFRVRLFRGLFGTIWGPELLAGTGSFACVADPHPVWGPSYNVSPTTKIDGNRISWTIRGSAIPRLVKVGTVFSDLHASVTLGEPASGKSTSNYERTASIDTTSSITWRYGS